MAPSPPRGPAAAADPNDVVKSTLNFVTAPTALRGQITTAPVLDLQNNGSGGALTATSKGGFPTISGSNVSSGLGGVGVAGFAPNGTDLAAHGSGRIRMFGHTFDKDNAYVPGEIHQRDGTVYAMVTATRRRVVAGPSTAGALHLIDPVRVYDSRRSAPAPGALTSGTNRVLSVADARNPSTGAVVTSNVVPIGVTGIAFNLTVTQTSNSGFLAIASGSKLATPTASIINWSAPGITMANASVVTVDALRRVRVFCGAGSTHLILDVVGYYL